MLKVYGIKNCNTVKKALDWLEENGKEYEFHDYKKSGITGDKITEWQDEVGWEPLINKRGTTWRKLDKEVQEGVNGPETASQLMQNHTSLIKRPIIEGKGPIILGFDNEEYTDKLL